jgi:hypothetical protein
MNFQTLHSGSLELYYSVYLGACATLIAGLSWFLHRTGQIFLNDALAGNTTLVHAVSRLLDLGFYLVSLGYVGLSYSTNWQMIDGATAVKIAIAKVGGLLLLLGVAHVFNLLVLALLRQRRAIAGPPAAEGESCHAR